MKHQRSFPWTDTAAIFFAVWLMLVLALAYGCRKEEPEPPRSACDAGGYGFLTVENFTNDAFAMFVDGAQVGELAPYGELDDLHVGDGTRQLHAVELGTACPLEYWSNLAVNECEHYSWELH